MAGGTIKPKAAASCASSFSSSVGSLIASAPRRWRLKPGWFRRAARAAGLSDEITLHDLRHFYASLLIRHGASIKTVQARLGHKSATETLDTYGHLWPDADEQTRNILNESLTGLRRADSKLGVLDKT
jgi:integrase